MRESNRVLKVALKNALLDEKNSPELIVATIFDTLYSERREAEMLASRASGCLDEFTMREGKLPDYLTSPLGRRELRAVPKSSRDSDEKLPFHPTFD